MSDKHFRIDIPATSANMGPGFDTFGIALKLFNSFYFKAVDSKFFELGSQDESIARNDSGNNLIYKSFCYALSCFDCKKAPSIEMRVVAEIPSARGLGSSATAVIAGVLAACAVTSTNLKPSEVVSVASQIEGHPDNVAPATYGGMTIAIQEEDWVYTQRVEWPDELLLIVGIPDIKVPTKASRKTLPRRVNLQDAVYNLRRSSLLINSLHRQDWTGLGISLMDKLHQDTRASLIPGLRELITECNRAGACGTVLSGSGPCILAVVERNNSAAIQSISDVICSTWKQLGISSIARTLDVHKDATRVKSISPQEFCERTKHLVSDETSKLTSMS